MVATSVTAVVSSPAKKRQASAGLTTGARCSQPPSVTEVACKIRLLRVSNKVGITHSGI